MEERTRNGRTNVGKRGEEVPTRAATDAEKMAKNRQGRLPPRQERHKVPAKWAENLRGRSEPGRSGRKPDKDGYHPGKDSIKPRRNGRRICGGAANPAGAAESPTRTVTTPAGTAESPVGMGGESAEQQRTRQERQKARQGQRCAPDKQEAGPPTGGPASTVCTRQNYPFTRAWSARNWARPLSVSGCLSSPLMAASGQVATSAPASRQRMMWFV